MKYAVLCTTLGIALAACTYMYMYVREDGEQRRGLEERAVYAELNADIHKKYGGYTVEELCEGYTAPVAILGKRQIEMEVMNQYPELPVGCEITCAAALLRFLGYSIDKCDLTDNYLPIGKTFSERDGVLYGPDPHECFVGDPYGKGYGCYKEVIAGVLNDYFNTHGLHYRAIIMDDANSADLEKLVDGGVPVIVWASIDMKPYRHNAVSEWQTESGDVIQWLSNSHTLILTGYDSSYYYFMDSWNKDEIQRYSKETFLSRWKENGSQTVAVKIN